MTRSVEPGHVHPAQGAWPCCALYSRPRYPGALPDHHHPRPRHSPQPTRHRVRPHQASPGTTADRTPRAPRRSDQPRSTPARPATPPARHTPGRRYLTQTRRRHPAARGTAHPSRTVHQARREAPTCREVERFGRTECDRSSNTRSCSAPTWPCESDAVHDPVSRPSASALPALHHAAP